MKIPSDVIKAKDNLQTFCNENSITEMVAVIQYKKEHTLVFQFSSNRFKNEFYNELKKALETILRTQSDQKDYICNVCGTKFTTDEVIIEPEGLEFYKKCPFCLSQKIDLL